MLALRACSDRSGFLGPFFIGGQLLGRTSCPSGLPPFGGDWAALFAFVSSKSTCQECPGLFWDGGRGQDDVFVVQGAHVGWQPDHLEGIRARDVMVAELARCGEHNEVQPRSPMAPQTVRGRAPKGEEFSPKDLLVSTRRKSRRRTQRASRLS